MKKIALTLVAFLGLIFTGCTEENNYEIKKPDPDQNPVITVPCASVSFQTNPLWSHLNASLAIYSNKTLTEWNVSNWRIKLYKIVYIKDGSYYELEVIPTLFINANISEFSDVNGKKSVRLINTYLNQNLYASYLFDSNGNPVNILRVEIQFEYKLLSDIDWIPTLKNPVAHGDSCNSYFINNKNSQYKLVKIITFNKN